MIRKLLLLFLLVFPLLGKAQNYQNRDSGLIQFSGLLLSSDSLEPIAFANIYVQKRPYGTYSNMDGYFSFVARKGDTIVFAHAEFKKSYFVIPDTLKDFKYSVVKLLTKDTFYFAGVMVVAMPSRATFDYLFVTREIPDDDIQRAKNNLEREELKDQSLSLSGSDASAAYKQISRMYADKAYYSGGQIPPMSIMNPFAWAQFFEAWKRGDYKRSK